MALDHATHYICACGAVCSRQTEERCMIDRAIYMISVSAHHAILGVS